MYLQVEDRINNKNILHRLQFYSSETVGYLSYIVLHNSYNSLRKMAYTFAKIIHFLLLTFVLNNDLLPYTGIET